jgi:uridine kinase
LLLYTTFQTTLARNLIAELGAENVAYLVHDSYYKDHSLTTPADEIATINFDHPSSLETDLLVQHVRDIKQGRVAPVPHYDFATHARTNQINAVQPAKIILVEGILIFCHKELVNEMDIKVFVVSRRIRCCRENLL